MHNGNNERYGSVSLILGDTSIILYYGEIHDIKIKGKTFCPSTTPPAHKFLVCIYHVRKDEVDKKQKLRLILKFSFESFQEALLWVTFHYKDVIDSEIETSSLITHEPYTNVFGYSKTKNKIIKLFDKVPMEWMVVG